MRYQITTNRFLMLFISLFWFHLSILFFFSRRKWLQDLERSRCASQILGGNHAGHYFMAGIYWWKKVCLRDLTVAIKDYFFLLSTYQTLLRFLDPKSLLECNFLNCLLKYDPLIYSRFAHTCYFIQEYACLTYMPLRSFWPWIFLLLGIRPKLCYFIYNYAWLGLIYLPLLRNRSTVVPRTFLTFFLENETKWRSKWVEGGILGF